MPAASTSAAGHGCTASAPEWDWLNTRLAVGTGERHPDRVVIRIFGDTDEFLYSIGL